MPMLLVVAAWVCMGMVLLLAWLWLQGRPHASRPLRAKRDDDNVQGLVCATATWFTILSVVMLTLHFAVPAEERRIDAMWATLRNLTMTDDSFSASGSYVRI